MPIYTYRCSECGVQFERHQSFSEPPLRTCPECGEDGLNKVFTPVGVVFKGPGFYSTDHPTASARSDSKNGKGESKTKTEPKSGAASGSSPDATPASPAPSKED